MRRLISVMGMVILLGGCAAPLSTREKGTLVGGALGAGAGAIIGNQVDHQGEGALIGGALGALSGALVGDQLQGQEGQQTRQQYEIEAQRREIERLRREIEDLRRDQSFKRGSSESHEKDYRY